MPGRSNKTSEPRKRRATPRDRIPRVITSPALADYLRVMTRAVFQAGVSWALIDAKWDAFERAFEQFDPAAVAAFGETDVERLLAESGILHSRRKIEGTIRNAKRLRELDAQPGGFGAWIDAFSNYGDASAALRREFAFLGELSVYYLLFRTGHRVPPFEEWETTVEGDHPRMREMVQLAREPA